MAKQLKIRYTVQSGSLPNGLVLDPDTGLLSGSVGFDALGLGPSWTSPASGSLGAFNENDTFTTATFAASSTKTPVKFSIVGGTIPWGLVFNSNTGVLSGTIAPLKLRINEAGSTSDGPAWQTSFGKLAGYDEGSTASITLSATPIGTRTMKSYQIVDGALPWGLRMNPQTGAITGVTAYLKNPGIFVDVPKLPVPVWTTSAGSLAVINEYDTGSWTLAATPASGRSMSKYMVQSGFLPFGFKLNSATGAITGAAPELLLRNEPPYYDPAKVITFNDTVGGINQVVLDGGSLGTYNKGNGVYCVFNRSTIPGFNGERWFLDSGSLPRGLKISNNGTISGTIVNSALTRSGLYTFRVGNIAKSTSSIDSYYGYRNYTITVN